MQRLETMKKILTINSIVNKNEETAIIETFKLKQYSKLQLKEFDNDIKAWCNNKMNRAKLNNDWRTYDTYCNLYNKIKTVIKKM